LRLRLNVSICEALQSSDVTIILSLIAEEYESWGNVRLKCA
jgi:hypothetical protein